MSGKQPSVLTRWHDIVDQGNFGMLEALLAPDVVFESPVLHTPQRGAEITGRYLEAAFGVLVNGDWRYVDEWYDDRSAVLEFETRIDGLVINGIDVMRWNADGLIDHFKVFIRPLKAVNAVHQMMAHSLEMTP